MSASYSIRAVAEKSGISVHTIRAWERRYQVLNPSRTESNRRTYSEQDVARLQGLRRAVEAGHSIGLIASLTLEELVPLARPTITNLQFDSFFEQCKLALLSLNAASLGSGLSRASCILGVDRFLAEVAIPLISFVDLEWSNSRLTITHEHMATAALKVQLERMRQAMQCDAPAPMLVVATPAHQHHELGALISAVVGASRCWNITYLGPNLPGEEIARAANQTHASAVAISLVHPEGDASVATDLARLAENLEPGVAVIAGGRAAESYASVLADLRATVCHSLDDLRQALDQVWAKSQSNE